MSTEQQSTSPAGQTRVRRCYNPGCTETLSYTNGQKIDEAFAIALGMWLTVTAENITPEGLKVDCKTFCSTQCLGEYIEAVTKEYNEAEDRAVKGMTRIATESLEALDKPDMKKLQEAAQLDPW